MGRVIAHPKVDLNYRGDAFQGPEVVGEAMGGGALQPQLHQLCALLVGQLAWGSRHGLGGQGRVATLLPGRSPLRHRMRFGELRQQELKQGTQ